MTDLGTLGGSASFGYGINDSGQVTGCSQTAGFQTHAFLWDGANPMLDLGTLGGSQSCGVSINRHGQVAGWSWLVVEPIQHAFRYSTGAGLETPASAGIVSRQASRRGAVVGWSWTRARAARCVLDAEEAIDLDSARRPSTGFDRGHQHGG
jgi:probable HAF family extracellular repeat protein